MKHKYIRFVPGVLWMALMFYFSSKPNLPSNGVVVVDFAIKKIAHLFEYMILNVFWYYAFAKKLPLSSFLVCFAYAFTDEIHQLFVPGRTGTLRDVGIDTIGIAISSIVIVKLELWKILSFPQPTKKQKVSQ